MDPFGWFKPNTKPSDSLPLQESEQDRTEGLKELRKLISKHPKKDTLERTDDEYLLRYLRCEKYDVKLALKRLFLSQEWRDENQMKTNLDFLSLIKILATKLVCVLPGTDSVGRTIIYVEVRHLDFERFKAMDYLFAAYLGIDTIIAASQEAQLNGISLIANCDQLEWKHFKLEVKIKAIDMLQNRFPMRIGDIFLVNQPTIISAMWNMVKPFVSKRVADRVRFFGKDYKLFHGLVDISLLPTFIGGTAPLEISTWGESLIVQNTDELTVEGEFSKKELEVFGITCEIIGVGVFSVWIDLVRKETPAARLGLRHADRLQKINGVDLKAPSELAALLISHPIPDSDKFRVSVVVRRATIETLGRAPKKDQDSSSSSSNTSNNSEKPK